MELVIKCSICELFQKVELSYKSFLQSIGHISENLSLFNIYTNCLKK